MRWSFSSATNIITVIIYAVIIFVILFFVRILVLYLVNGELSSDVIFKPREITSNELSLNVGQHSNQTEASTRDIALVDSSKAANNNSLLVDYYIIIGSFRNRTQAGQRAEKVQKDFNANVILLPPTNEGNYRISFGRYSSLEEAKNAIINVRKNLNSEAWVLTVKK